MAKYISRETVQAVMEKLARASQDEADYTTQAMLAEQPVIVEYLCRLDMLPFELEEDVHFNEVEEEYILFVGIVVWKTLTENSAAMRPVTWEELATVIANYEAKTLELARLSETDRLGDALLMIENHPEPELFRFITDALRYDPDDPPYPPIRPEYQTAASMIFEIVLDTMLDSRTISGD